MGKKDNTTIICPFCQYDFNKNPEDIYKRVTFWGEEGAEECECPECKKKFFVEEVVKRTWKIGLTVDTLK